MKERMWNSRELTDLDISAGIKQNIVRLDVTMYDVLAVEMGETFASLFKVSNLSSDIVMAASIPRCRW